jgi:hypothetical protein
MFPMKWEKNDGHMALEVQGALKKGFSKVYKKWEKLWM